MLNINNTELFNKISFPYKLSVKINELNDCANIKDILDIKIQKLENTCLEFGFIKKKGITIISYSYGYLNPVIFCPFIEYKLLCSCDVFYPTVNDIYKAKIVSINKIGIMCKVYYYFNNKKYVLINAIISKHNQDPAKLININVNDDIYIKLIGFKFAKYATFINAICDITSNKEIEQIKKYSNLINNLININISNNIDFTKYYKYKNILKLILNKINISNKELFIYNFIIENKIDINSKNYVKLYQDYINNISIENNNKQEDNNNTNNISKYYISKNNNSYNEDTETEDLDFININNESESNINNDDYHDNNNNEHDEENEEDDEESEEDEEDNDENNNIINDDTLDINDEYEYDDDDDDDDEEEEEEEEDMGVVDEIKDKIKK